MTAQGTQEQAAAEQSLPAVPGRRRPAWRWLVGAIVVAVLIIVTVGLFSAQVNNTRADDPRSPGPSGTAALAQLLVDEGVRIVPTDNAGTAAELTTSSTTLVVANADRLSDSDARRLATAPYGRLILLRPSLLGLRACGVGASTDRAEVALAQPGCADAAAVRAGPIALEDALAVYRSDATPLLSCYPVGEGSAYLRTAGTGGPVDLVAGGVANEWLDDEGNAAFGMNVFGSQPTLVWLMGERTTAPSTGSGEPRLLPPWGGLALTQLLVALVIIAVWRGRRLGPILTEVLPVRVRSSETVIGHGRLYYRIGARERSAEALRTVARERLGRRFGHRFDPDALTASLVARTGREPAQIWHWLYGPAPETDENLAALARDLDQLEQEARA